MANSNSKEPRTADNTTISELLTTIAPPREDCTGVHLTAVDSAYILTVQGPEALHMTRLILDFVETLHDVAEEKQLSVDG